MRSCQRPARENGTQTCAGASGAWSPTAALHLLHHAAQLDGFTVGDAALGYARRSAELGAAA